MNFNQLLEKFNSGINWNAYFYATHKITATVVIFLLYNKLDLSSFAAWANINSIIFLILLWADLGFRKSIPRYAPVFLKNAQAHKIFIRSLILCQITILVMTMPFLYYSSKSLQTTLNIDNIYAFSIIPFIFLTEGLIAILRLIYHAHFEQKFFNLLTSFMLITETLINIGLIFLTNENARLLSNIFLTKTIMSSITIIFLASSLKKIYAIKQHEIIDTRQLTKDFIVHSLVMWLTSTLRSLSERNFMIPLLTYMFGPLLASAYKIANDSALIFQRIVLKTVGTADTTFLSYVEVAPEEKKLTEVAFKKLATKMAALRLPLLGIIGLIMCWFFIQKNNTLVFHIFCIISISYLLEAMLLPYERVLEVKRSYRALMHIYLFYALLLLFLIISLSTTLIGLRTAIALLCCVRLVSMFMMAYAAFIHFSVHFPFNSFFLFLKRILYSGIVLIPFIFIVKFLIN
jgi:hypothetical protein